MVVRLRNAGAVKKQTTLVPFSQLKMAIAGKLAEHGYIKSAELKGKKVKKMLEVALAYNEDGTPKIRGTKRISKPGRRMYTLVRNIAPVKFGHGTVIISTPKGILTGTEARKQNVGGEILFEIW